jgi:hypothetical protein
MILLIFIAGRKMTATEAKWFCLYSEPFCWSEVQRRQITPPAFCVSPVVPSAQIAHFSSFFERRKSYEQILYYEVSKV